MAALSIFKRQVQDLALRVLAVVGNVLDRSVRKNDNCNLESGRLSDAIGSAAALFLSFIVILPACAASGAMTVPQLKFETIAKNTRSGVREPLQIVVRSPEQWKALWKKHVASDPNSPPAPAVDFNNNIVAAVFSGEKPTGGYAVEIIAAEKSDGALLIYYREMSPRPGSIVTQVLTQPFHMVTVSGGNNLQAVFRRAS
jgi:hypothetical protein